MRAISRQVAGRYDTCFATPKSIFTQETLHELMQPLGLFRKTLDNQRLAKIHNFLKVIL